jgi:PIN domain nuclease of toxin-antitoxin system
LRQQSRTVLDASAIMAVLWNEPGAEIVAVMLGSSVTNAVNLSEVVAKLADKGMTRHDIQNMIEELRLNVVSFNVAQAYSAGFLRPATRSVGLSFGDRCCLATAQILGLPAVTADRSWAELDLGVEVRLIR